MKNELVGISVGIVCALVLIGTVLVPMVDSVTAETLTYTNEGMPFAEVDEDTHTITVTSSEITVDGETIDQDLFPSGFSSYTLVYATDGFVRYDVNSVLVRSVGSSFGIANMSISSGETITIAIDGSSVTVSSSDTDIESKTLSDVQYFICNEGDMVLSANPYVNSTSVIVGEGQTGYSTSAGLPATLNISVYWSGTVAEVTGNVVLLVSSSVWSSGTVDEVTVNTTEIEDGLYRIDSVVLNMSVTYASTSTDYDVSATYTYFLAPYEVVYDNPDYIGDVESALITVIPLFLILAVLVTITYAVMRNRD